MNTSPARCYYWYQRYVHFGQSNTTHVSLGTFKAWELPAVYLSVLEYLKNYPQSSLEDIRAMLQREFERQVTKSVCSRTLQKMGWSWKIPVCFQIAKYSILNLERYCDFLEWIQTMNMSKLKFADEAHVIAKKLSSRKVLKEIQILLLLDAGIS
jgi:hypothetical protein